MFVLMFVVREVHAPGALLPSMDGDSFIEQIERSHVK